jgi:signal transduction histidine kinase
MLNQWHTLNKQLRTLESARRQMLANLVHELARPLGAVQAAVDALRGGADEDEAFRKELLTGIAGEIKRLGRLIESLAQLHGQILGTFELKRRPIALSEWLLAVLSPWYVSALEKEQQWESKLPEGLPTTREIVAAHGGRLALQSSSEGSELTVYLPLDE